MPLLLLGALAALPWVATLGLRMNILFDPPAQVDRPRHRRSRKRKPRSASTTRVSPDRTRSTDVLDISQSPPEGSRRGEAKARATAEEEEQQQQSVAPVTGRGVMEATSPEQDETTAERRRRAVRETITMRANQQTPIRNDGGESSDQPSSAMASTMSPPMDSFADGNRRLGSYYPTPPLGQHDSRKMLPPQMAQGHKFTHQDPMVEEYMLFRSGVNGAPRRMGSGGKLGQSFTPEGFGPVEGGGEEEGLYGNATESAAYTAIWGTERHDIFWGWEGAGRGGLMERVSEGEQQRTRAGATPVTRGWPELGLRAA